MTFSELGLREELLRAIQELGFESPTPVQAEAIPAVLTSDEDLVSLAQTGTGKTAAFGLPVLQALMADSTDANGRRYETETRALILAPTRELCLQISKDLMNYGKYSGLRIVAVYGGEDIRKQLYLLDRTPDIIVATPGRLLDLISRGKVQLGRIRYLVLDEADEMLNLGFKDDLDQILSSCPEERTTMLFSATMPQEIARIAKTYMRHPREIQIGDRNAGTENVEHTYYVCRAEHRYEVLKRIVDMVPDIYGIVFCRTKADCQEVAERLIKDGYSADALHGDLTQVARDNVMQRFRLGAVQLLVATDVAARGLDVHNLTHVINYQLPDDPEIYTHRSGRTGRAGKKGVSVAIVHLRETRRIQNLERMLKRDFHRLRIPTGMDVCKKQLFNQIARIQAPELADSQAAQPIEDYEKWMQEAFRMLEYVSKEDLIRRFVDLELGRFVTYYQDAPDLNVEERKGKKSEEVRGKSGEVRAKSEERRGEKGGRGMIRLKMNAGQRDGLDVRSFLALVNQTTHDRSIHLGNIEVQKNYTFFDVYPDQMPKLVRAFGIYEDLTIQEMKLGKKSGEGKPYARRGADSKPYNKKKNRKK